MSDKLYRASALIGLTTIAVVSTERGWLSASDMAVGIGSALVVNEWQVLARTVVRRWKQSHVKPIERKRRQRRRRQS